MAATSGGYPSASYPHRLERKHAVRLPRIAAVLVAVVLSLVVVVTGPAKPAAAWAGTPAPITIGTALKSAPVRMLTMTSPWGLALNGAALAGVALYETKDSWWPIVSDWATGGTDTDTPNTTASCKTVLSASVSTYNVTASAAKGACGASSGYSFYVDQVSCRTPAGLLVGNAMTNNFSTHSNNTTVTRTFAVCPTDSTVQSARVRECLNTSGCATPVSNTVFLQQDIAASEWTQTATVECKQPDGTIVTISDTMVGQPDRVVVPSCADRVPGSIPWSATVTGGPQGGVSTEIIKITTNQDVYGEYADCFGPTGLVCSIRVFIGGEACVRGDLACVEWQEYAIDYPNRVECRFGTHVLNLNQCDALKNAYKTKTQTVIETDPQGNPITDPDAGTPEAGGGTPTTGTNPITTPAIDSSADPDTSSCFGGVWSWNPVDWVYVPVKCSFLWAFKPKVLLQTRVDSIKQLVATKAPFSWLTGLSSLPGAIPDGGCPVDWRVKVGPLDENVVCDSSYTAAIRAARPVLTAMMITLAMWPLIRSTAYAAIPIIKPVPSGGGR